jgi:hypothetical protein
MTPTDPPPLPSSSAPSLRQVALGVFIIGQLVYLLGYNALEMLHEGRGSLSEEAAQVVDVLAPGWPRGKGQLWDTSNLALTNLRRWMQVTGQDQSWSLFAPAVYKDGWFPALLISWDDNPPLPGPEQIAAASSAEKMDLFLSDDEPRDYQHYFRVGNYRLRRYESMMLANLTVLPDEDLDARKKRWQERIDRHFKEYGALMFAYVRWRYAEYQRRHPERLPARAIILLERHYHAKPPGEGPPGWDEFFTVPLGRWRPAVTWDEQILPLERYDPVTGQFESVWK